MIYVVSGRQPSGRIVSFNFDIPSRQFPSIGHVQRWLAQKEIIFLEANMKNGSVGSTGYRDPGGNNSRQPNNGLRGYYFTDPSGMASWWIPDGYTPETSPYNPTNFLRNANIDKGVVTTPYTGGAEDIPLEEITANLDKYRPDGPSSTVKNNNVNTVTTTGVSKVINANGKIYRLLLKNPAGGPFVESGATYPSCSRTNPGGCVPLEFANRDDAMYYSKTHNEIPVWVNSAEQAWNIIEGKEPIPSSISIGSVLLLALPFIGKFLKK